jgi:ribosome maturation factor RimP
VTAKGEVADQIHQSIQGLVEDAGCELVYVQYLPEKLGALVRIYIDKEGGVDLGDCQRVSRKAGVLLDVEDLVAHRYTLEVSSPGLERPLFSASDFEKYAGNEIRLTTRMKVGDRRNFKGLLKGIRTEVIELECEGEVFQIPLENVKKANLIHRFE